MSIVSSGVVRFTRVRPLCKWVHPGLFPSLACVLVVVGFILGRLIPTYALLRSLVCALGVIVCHWVHFTEARVSVFGCTRACPGGRCVHSRASWGHPGLLHRALRVLGFTRVCPRGCWRHPVWLGSLAHALGVVVFIRGRWVLWRAPWWLLGISLIVRFTRAHPGGCWLHPVLLSSLARALEVVGFIRDR